MSREDCPHDIGNHVLWKHVFNIFTRTQICVTYELVVINQNSSSFQYREIFWFRTPHSVLLHIRPCILLWQMVRAHVWI